tara:strand:- start:5980 stop:6258 length:279 start_codon:yes stop_codon:yes gene_type:complete
MKLKQLQTIEEFLKFLQKEEEPDDIIKYLDFRLKSLDPPTSVPLEVFASDTEGETSEEEDELLTTSGSSEEEDIDIPRGHLGQKKIQIKLSL